VTNILKAEEKRDQVVYDWGLDSSDQEALKNHDLTLFGVLGQTEEKIGRSFSMGKGMSPADFLEPLAQMRPAIDAFFDAVTINDPNPEIRRCRLLLLSTVRHQCHAVADFSKIVS
jgi:glycyl-tRNA synthetase beta chain